MARACHLRVASTNCNKNKWKDSNGNNNGSKNSNTRYTTNGNGNNWKHSHGSSNMCRNSNLSHSILSYKDSNWGLRNDTSKNVSKNSNMSNSTNCITPIRNIKINLQAHNKKEKDKRATRNDNRRYQWDGVEHNVHWYYWNPSWWGTAKAWGQTLEQLSTV